MKISFWAESFKLLREEANSLNTSIPQLVNTIIKEYFDKQISTNTGAPINDNKETR